jgi:hypothetical protein
MVHHVKGQNVIRAFGLLCVVWSSLGLAQTIPTCRAQDVELFSEGADGGLGHGLNVVGLRNVSAAKCTLSGTPQLKFFDSSGGSLDIPYAKNDSDYMFDKQPEKQVNLEPGSFAYFMIGMSTGDQHLRFDELRVALPGDRTELALTRAGPMELQSIDVSAVVPGTYTNYDWIVPTKRIEQTGGALYGLSLTLEVPEKPVRGFDAHFVLKDSGTTAYSIDSSHCTLHETLTNSDGKEVTASQNCGRWQGNTNPEGLLMPGARVSADLTIAEDEVVQQICRTGQWTASLSLELPLGIVQFEPFPFQVTAAPCK